MILRSVCSPRFGRLKAAKGGLQTLNCLGRVLALSLLGFSEQLGRLLSLSFIVERVKIPGRATK